MGVSKRKIYNIAVWSLEDALIAAYEQGRKDGQNESKN